MVGCCCKGAYTQLRPGTEASGASSGPTPRPLGVKLGRAEPGYAAPCASTRVGLQGRTATEG